MIWCKLYAINPHCINVDFSMVYRLTFYGKIYIVSKYLDFIVFLLYKYANVEISTVIDVLPDQNNALKSDLSDFTIILQYIYAINV